jgi:calcineurin-like phosphoesterase family protein
MNAYEQEVVNRALSPKATEADKNAYQKLRLSKESVNLHDETLIANWNAKVPLDGIVYHLGDFCFDERKAHSILDRLNGQIFLIKGNHDKKINSFKHRFGWVRDYYELNVEDPQGGRQMIVLCHYAMRVWNKSHHGSFMCYGHSHGSLEDDPHAKSFDVGVDCHNYEPISYNEVKKIMAKKSYYRPVDHHGSGKKLTK